MREVTEPGNFFPDDLSDEWREWISLTPAERFHRSEVMFAQYLAMGGSLDPDPDPDSPFYDPRDYEPGGYYAGWRSDISLPAFRLER